MQQFLLTFFWVVLRTKPTALHMLGKAFITKLQPSIYKNFTLKLSLKESGQTYDPPASAPSMDEFTVVTMVFTTVASFNTLVFL